MSGRRLPSLPFVCSFRNSQTVFTTSDTSGISYSEKAKIPDNDKKVIFQPPTAPRRNFDGVFHQSVRTIEFFFFASI